MSGPAKLSTTTKLGYGIGQAADGIKTTAFTTFLFFYYNQVLELSGSLAGLAALLALVVDAITDPMVGQLSDQFRSKWGRRHPFMLMGALPFTACMVALFTPPEALGEMQLFAWMLGWGIAVRVMLTFFFVPHLSLGAEMVRDYHQRTGLIAYRVFFANVGVLVTSVLGFALFFPSVEGVNGMLNGDNYASFGWFVGIVATVCMLITVFSTFHLVPHLAEPQRQEHDKNPILGFITVFTTLKEHAFRILFFSTLMFMVIVGTSQTLLIHVATYILGFGPEQLALLSTSLIIGIVLSPLVANSTSRKFDKKQALGLCVCVGAALSTLPFILYFAGALQTMDIDQKFVLVYMGSGSSQAFFIAYVILLDSMMSDIADQHELTSGKREEGLFFAARSLATKASYGLGTFFAGIAMQLVEFPTGASPETVPIEAIDKLAIIAGPVILTLMCLTTLISRRYPLNAQRHAEIVKEISTRVQT